MSAFLLLKQLWWHGIHFKNVWNDPLPLHVTSQNTKQKVVAMETQYKLAARSAQLLAKDAPQDEATRVMATMATVKGQLSKVSLIWG